MAKGYSVSFSFSLRFPLEATLQFCTFKNPADLSRDSFFFGLVVFTFSQMLFWFHAVSFYSQAQYSIYSQCFFKASPNTFHQTNVF